METWKYIGKKSVHYGTEEKCLNFFRKKNVHITDEMVLIHFYSVCMNLVHPISLSQQKWQEASAHHQKFFLVSFSLWSPNRAAQLCNVRRTNTGL